MAATLNISPNPVFLDPSGVIGEMDGEGTINIYGSGFEPAGITLRIVHPDNGGTTYQRVMGPSFTATQLIWMEGTGRVDAVDTLAAARQPGKSRAQHVRSDVLASAPFSAVVA